MDTQIVKIGVVHGIDVRILDKPITLKSWIHAYDVLRRATSLGRTIVSITRNGGRKYALVGIPNAFNGGILAPKNKACRDAVRVVIGQAQHYPSPEAAIAAHILTSGHDNVPV